MSLSAEILVLRWRWPPASLAGSPHCALGGLGARAVVSSIASALQVVEEPFAADALRIARGRRFDRLLVDPDCADAMAFVHSIKGAHSIHRSVPLFVMPVALEPDYAIIVEPPHWSWLQSERELPLEHAVAWLDIDALIRSSPPRG